MTAFPHGVRLLITFCQVQLCQMRSSPYSPPFFVVGNKCLAFDYPTVFIITETSKFLYIEDEAAVLLLCDLNICVISVL